MWNIQLQTFFGMLYVSLIDMSSPDGKNDIDNKE